MAGGLPFSATFLDRSVTGATSPTSAARVCRALTIRRFAPSLTCTVSFKAGLEPCATDFTVRAHPSAEFRGRVPVLPSPRRTAV